MKNIEQVFIDTKTIFQDQINSAVEEALDKIYTEYLPHVENDTTANVYFQTCDWLRKFMTDSLTVDDIKVETLAGYSAMDVRAKLFQDNKAELSVLIGEDIVERIAELENRQNYHWERKYV